MFPTISMHAMFILFLNSILRDSLEFISKQNIFCLTPNPDASCLSIPRWDNVGLQWIYMLKYLKTQLNYSSINTQTKTKLYLLYTCIQVFTLYVRICNEMYINQMKKKPTKTNKLIIEQNYPHQTPWQWQWQLVMSHQLLYSVLYIHLQFPISTFMNI